MFDERQATRSVSMKPRRRCVLAACGAVLGLALSLGAPGPAAAQRGGAELLPSQGVSLQEAVQIATMSQPGRVVRAVTVDIGGGRRMHEVRILLDEGGRVVTVRVDAQTGRVR